MMLMFTTTVGSKTPRTMKSKQLNAIRIYRDDQWLDKIFAKGDEFDYSKMIVYFFNGLIRGNERADHIRN